MSINFNDFQTLLEKAVRTIVNLREEAESIRDQMEEIISACETIEDDL